MQQKPGWLFEVPTGMTRGRTMAAAMVEFAELRVALDTLRGVEIFGRRDDKDRKFAASAPPRGPSRHLSGRT